MNLYGKDKGEEPEHVTPATTVVACGQAFVWYNFEWRKSKKGDEK